MAYNKRSNKPVVVHNYVTTGSSNSKRVLLIVIALLLAVFLVVGYFGFKEVIAGKGEIVYEDKTSNGSVDITFDEEGNLVVDNSGFTTSDVYFGEDSVCNFLNFKQQNTVLDRGIFRSDYIQTGYELEVNAYLDGECSKLVKYIIAWDQGFNIYQVIKIDNLEKSYFGDYEVDNYEKYFDKLCSLDCVFYVSDKGNSDFNKEGFNRKDLLDFEMPQVLYFTNGDYRLEMSSEKSFLEVFTIMLKARASSGVKEGVLQTVALNVSEFCHLKIYSIEHGEYLSVKNKVCLVVSYFNFDRVQSYGRFTSKGNTVLASDLLVDVNYKLCALGGSGLPAVSLTGYVIKY